MYNYLDTMMNQAGIPGWVFCILTVIFIWTYVWKLLALWNAGKNNSPVWFIVLALVNTVGILEILYIFVFSKMKHSSRAPRHRKRRR